MQGMSITTTHPHFLSVPGDVPFEGMYDIIFPSSFSPWVVLVPSMDEVYLFIGLPGFFEVDSIVFVVYSPLPPTLPMLPRPVRLPPRYRPLLLRGFLYADPRSFLRFIFSAFRGRVPTLFRPKFQRCFREGPSNQCRESCPSPRVPTR